MYQHGSQQIGEQMDQVIQERPSPGLQRLVSTCRGVYLEAPQEANPLVVIADFVERLTTEKVRHSFELLLIHNVAVALSGQLQDLILSPLEVSKLFLRAYLARELFADEEVRARVLASPYGGVLPVPAAA